MLEVLEPGLLTTVQDDGRPDAVVWGVPRGGACDRWSLGVANALAGNAPAAPALEATLAGPTLRALDDSYVGLAGADLEARLDGVPLPPASGVLLRRGQTLAFGAAGGGSGARAYLALAGGVDVPPVLGSASTCLVGGFGGIAGRRLQAGDVIRAPGRSAAPVAERRWIGGPQPAAEATRRPLRVLPGPHGEWLAADALKRLTAGEYHVSARGDRQAIVLDGPPLGIGKRGGTLLSTGVVWGAVQVPPDGRPICLLADHQTVGGYPVVAIVISADLPLLGQLGPGDPVTFALVTHDDAIAALRQQADDFEAGLARLGEPA